MAIKRFYKIITPKSPNVDISDSHDVSGANGLYGNYTWYNRVVQGSADRAQRYREYESMDQDIDVSRALDVIAEEMTGNNPKTELPLQLLITADNEQRVPSNVVVTVQAALKTWCKLQSWDVRLYNLVRGLIKYGDVFYFRPKKKNKKWTYIQPERVIEAVVAIDDITDVRGWRIKSDTKKAEGGVGTNVAFNVSGGMYDQNVDTFNADEIIRYTLNDEMSKDAPFGVSILRAAYKVFKQKELLEDSILIYRISRAPERRVFYIDTGKMPPHKVSTHLEQMKNEIKQRKIPTMQGGTNTIESVYNPMSTSEDYFLAVSEGRANSRIETLPGGQNLGSLDDLQYFYQKIWRALRVPASYVVNTVEDGQAFNDGAVGIAYQQEIKFSEYIERLQKYVEMTMDTEFKKFLHDMNIVVDTTIFKVQLPAPTNWAKSRQNKIDAELTNVYNGMKDDPAMAKRFSQRKWLQLTKEEVILNERLLREEKGLDPDGGIQDLPKLYWPEEAEAGGFEGGLGGVAGSDQPTGDDEGLENGDIAEDGVGNGEEGADQQGGNAGQANTPQNNQQK